MFPLLIGAFLGAGSAILSQLQHEVDVEVSLDGERMVEHAIEKLELRARLDAMTDEVQQTLMCVRLLLVVVGVWYMVRMAVWVVWCWRGENLKEKGREQPVMLVSLARDGARALVGELGVAQLHDATVSRQRARSSL